MPVERGPRLRTERLVLRPWRQEDREPFAAMNADPEVMEYFPARLSPTESDAFVDRIEAEFDEMGYGLFAVEVVGGLPFIGFVGLHQVRADVPAPLPCSPAVEVGWRLARPAWGQGYAPEGARTCLELAFGELGLREVVSFTSVVNDRSRRVMTKIGMQRDLDADFDHPALAPGSPLRPHVLYRAQRSPG